ncbi:putative cupin superfamily protein [Rhizobium herbae]|uniref:Cupin superfamily protein n=2 Tax=Rhizobium herbae TaxID=508661 RepID=A0ABS4EH92_9HYPH|nr:putative cupin superfamily protein [Rhizobium herbae]
MSGYIAWNRETPKGAALGRRWAMKTFASACVLTVLIALPAWSATIINKDADAAVLVVVEGENRMEVAIGAGGTESICPSGCFITTPSGDRIGLQGDETIEIVKGSAVVK